MRETIIFAPGLKGIELATSLARIGVASFNMRVCGAVELAKLALMRSGIGVAELVLSSDEEAALIAEAVNGVDYFHKPSYSDILKITDAIRTMRCLAAGENEGEELEKTMSKGIFDEKNKALLSVYRKYMELLSEGKILLQSDSRSVKIGDDNTESEEQTGCGKFLYTDAIGLMRKAILKCNPLDAELLTLKEYPLNPLEKALLEKLSAGKYSETDLSHIYRAGEKGIKTESIKRCYGAANEVESILADVYGNKSADCCTVALADAEGYSQLFFDYAMLYDISISFGCGMAVTNSNPAKLLVLYHRWLSGGFFSGDALMEMINSPAFDKKKLTELLFPGEETDSDDEDTDGTGEKLYKSRFYEILGSLRLTNDPSVNVKRLSDFRQSLKEEEKLLSGAGKKDMDRLRQKQPALPALEIMAGELALPEEEFISKYAYIRKGSGSEKEKLLMHLDIEALSAICDKLKAIRAVGASDGEQDSIPEVLRLKVYPQDSQPGKLHITDIKGAFCTLRENIYIAGLSASVYPGSPKEDYLLLDDDLSLFGEAAEHLTSDNRVRQKGKTLMSLLRLATGLGSKIYLSYAGLNVSELKKDNASSLIFELFSEEKGSENVSWQELQENITDVGYFEPAVSPMRFIGQAYNAGKALKADICKCDGRAEFCVVSEAEFSPTALESFFACPRKFMLSRLLGLPEESQEEPFEIISAKDKGNLAHMLMGRLGSTDMGKEAFLGLCAKGFDTFTAQNPPLIPENVVAQRDSFLEMMETAYEMEPHREIVLEEEDIHCVHECGVKLHGLPDRVEKLEDGSCMIVDFKTGRTVKQSGEDLQSCLQVLVYAYMMEQKGYNVSCCEYRYISLGETVSCIYDDAARETLSDMLKAFKEHMEKGDFPVAQLGEDDADPCKYCSYAYVCEGSNNIDSEGD